jgi:hypothetical protein
MINKVGESKWNVVRRNGCYKVARILVNPTAPPMSVCPTPQIIAYAGIILVALARCTNAMAALLIAPDVSGVSVPMKMIITGKNLRQIQFPFSYKFAGMHRTKF